LGSWTLCADGDTPSVFLICLDAGALHTVAQAIPILQRQDGLLVAVPAGALDDEAIAASWHAPGQCGAAEELSVAATARGGTNPSKTLKVGIIVMDLALEGLERVVEEDEDTEVLPFITSAGREALPHPGALLEVAKTWLLQRAGEDTGGRLSEFQTADEGRGAPEGRAGGAASAAGEDEAGLEDPQEEIARLKAVVSKLLGEAARAGATDIGRTAPSGADWRAAVGVMPPWSKSLTKG